MAMQLAPRNDKPKGTEVGQVFKVVFEDDERVVER
jgi:hypothetical protein